MVTIPKQKRKVLKTFKFGTQKSNLNPLIIDYFLVSFLKGPIFFSNDNLWFSKTPSTLCKILHKWHWFRALQRKVTYTVKARDWACPLQNTILHVCITPEKNCCIKITCSSRDFLLTKEPVRAVFTINWKKHIALPVNNCWNSAESSCPSAVSACSK